MLVDLTTEVFNLKKHKVGQIASAFNHKYETEV